MTRIGLTTIVWVFVSGVANAQANLDHIAREVGMKTPQTKETLELFLIDRRAMIERLAKSLSDYETTLVRLKKQKYESPKEKDEAMRPIEESIKTLEASLKDPPAPIPVIFTNRLSVGRVGKLQHAENVLFCVVKVVQVIDKNSILAAPDYENTDRIWVSGIDTSGIVDGKSMFLKDYWEVVGTKSYTTAIGTKKTVFEVRPFDIAPYLAKADAKFREMYKAAVEQAQAKRRAIEEAKYRIWTDSTGKYKIDAKFEKLIGGKVYLTRRDNGKEIALPLTKLSDADQKFIRDKLKR